MGNGEKALTAEMREELTDLIRYVLRNELAVYEHPCRFAEGSEDISMIQENHRWLALQRRRSDRMSTAFFVTIVTAVTGGLCTAAWLGLKHLLYVTK